jgi:hypothetical protein
VILLSDAALANTGLALAETIPLTNNFGATTEATLIIIGTVRQSIDVLGWVGAAVMPAYTCYRNKGVSGTDASQASSARSTSAREIARFLTGNHNHGSGSAGGAARLRSSCRCSNTSAMRSPRFVSAR